MYKILLLIILFCSGCDENNSNNKPYIYPLNVYSSYYKFSDENVFITDEGCHGLPGFYTLPLDIRITVGNDVFEKTVKQQDLKPNLANHLLFGRANEKYYFYQDQKSTIASILTGKTAGCRKRNHAGNILK